MLENVNDSKENAIELANLIKNINCYVNLIPYNEVNTKDYRSTAHDAAEEFFVTLFNQQIKSKSWQHFASNILLPHSAFDFHLPRINEHDE